jgi:ubiquinone/menaquinone biosynthesis C-methylase UbiE
LQRGAQKVSDKFVNLFEIRPGDKILDIATCIGEQPITAAKRVKPDVKVLFLMIFASRYLG